ncbi:MAG: hypothetical protein V4526_02795 [Patescibacteria group bacterium]
MKFTFAIIAAIISLSSIGVAQAQLAVETNTAANVQLNAKTNSTFSIKASTSATVKGKATSSIVNVINNGTTSRGNATSAASRNNDSDHDNNKGAQMSETHRSVVAMFVHSLLSVANREGGIGTQVRAVAQSQNDSSTTTIAAIAEVEKRGSLRTFFFGSDYKNLGVIRSGMVTTANNIAKLKTLVSQATNASSKAELNVQIEALEDEQAELNAYVEAHEDTFSLFGWMNK